MSVLNGQKRSAHQNADDIHIAYLHIEGVNENEESWGRTKEYS